MSDANDAQRSPAELVDEIASELNLLSLSWTNPEAFLERRDFLTKRLRRLSKRMAGEPPRRQLFSPPAAARAHAKSGRSPERETGAAWAGRPLLTLPKR
ncbi:MAG: hypothetical protein ACYDD1_17000 [Caulobacteraceae bacterium]